MHDNLLVQIPCTRLVCTIIIALQLHAMTRDQSYVCHVHGDEHNAVHKHQA